MSKQTTIGEGDEVASSLFYREVRRDGEKMKRVDFTEGDAEAVQEVVDDIAEKASRSSSLSDLERPGYFIRWIESILDSSTDMADDPAALDGNNVVDLAEHFAEHMKTRAREKGKYVVVIVSSDQLIICHSYTGKRALTTDMAVIEELLSSTNIDKHAEFRRNEDEITVKHFEKYASQSFVNWLGIKSRDVVYEIKGDVKIHTSIDGVECTFEFSKDDVVEKIIESDNYSIDGNVLKTPTHTGPIRYIGWGGGTYSNSDDFKQEMITVHYEIDHYVSEYYETKESISNWSYERKIDREDRVSLITDGEEESIDKSVEGMKLLFVNDQIKIENSWLVALADSMIGSTPPLHVCHVGNEFSERPSRIGNYRIYNKLGLTSDQLRFVNQLIDTASEFGTDNMRNLLLHTAFTVIRDECRTPIAHFFRRLEEEYRDRFYRGLEGGTKFVKNERAGDIEFKAGDWFLEGEDDDLVEKIVEEFEKSANIILGGWDEQTQTVDGVLESRFSSDRLGALEDLACKENGYAKGQVKIWTVPVGDNHCAINAIKLPRGTT